MKGNLDKILSQILVFEGGYVNDPDDPGGETNYGISKRAFPKEDIRHLTSIRAKELYTKHYWEPIKGDEIPSGLDLCVMNCAVNTGPGTALGILKAATNADHYLWQQVVYYLSICKKHPTQKKYLWDWIFRTTQVRSIIWDWTSVA